MKTTIKLNTNEKIDLEFILENFIKQNNNKTLKEKARNLLKKLSPKQTN
jgi:hypothetical protein